ncbi:organic hydroperoxide resistance protein [Actinosynnema sp. NPDC053489]|uniref:organic hydroperoxide resistance protein n=1 Tax=Actinosynnema sp. NPDC053489 TaxID=3363916 RepID=UPI0037C70CEE
MPVVYTAVVVSSGDGRQGVVASEDGAFELQLAAPKEVGGSGAGSNPEQLFAAGYAACFHSALRLVARAAGTTLTDDTVTASVDLVRDDESGYHVAVRLVVALPGVERRVAEELAEQAHQRCPYSKATRGNIDVTVLTEV